MSNFIKIHILGDELFHANGRADRHTEMKPKVAFRNFAKSD